MCVRLSVCVCVCITLIICRTCSVWQDRTRVVRDSGINPYQLCVFPLHEHQHVSCVFHSTCACVFLFVCYLLFIIIIINISLYIQYYLFMHQPLQRITASVCTYLSPSTVHRCFYIWLIITSLCCSC